MFFPEGQIRIRLYGAPCDMRKYGPRFDMRSDGGDRAFQWNEARLALCITRCVFHRLQHCEKFVRRSEASASKCRRCCKHERFELLGGIRAEVDLGALQVCVTEPK